ncbi:hypothetical protein Q5424_00905 [Conexibacter sp. JD483]|uniref:hypothetical protein n=1 Tax=unclassified Conexibacter TaxID=2627773 RepID=UPI0027237AE8|nr:MULTISPECIES: hypothetical protein [unclassified Conexibacter]MDO8189029.1 hypothetical protein [Conexibacter sp. CPCC 205706]MDO8198530.1 hypothetical protein [Conexibacter sp. CPCC 205762]MDR9367616.1 hypothetical protein [Conexibacter sp. JD483]
MNELRPALLLDWAATASSFAADLQAAADRIATARAVGAGALLAVLFDLAPIARGEPRVLEFGVKVEGPAGTLRASVVLATLPRIRGRRSALEPAAWRYDAVVGHLRPLKDRAHTTTRIETQLTFRPLPDRIRFGELPLTWASHRVSDLVEQINAAAAPTLLQTIVPQIVNG